MYNDLGNLLLREAKAGLQFIESDILINVKLMATLR
jgi:hypothetical protein